MEPSIEILGTSLLREKEHLSYLHHWKKVLSKEIGWHYPLDVIWQLKQLETLEDKNAVIIDAGAGTGIMQFLAADQGYDVISVDFDERSKPKMESLFFNIELKNDQKFEHEYIKHLSSNGGKKIPKVSRLLKMFNPSSVRELLKNKSSRGKITFLKADLADLAGIEDGSIDAIFSTSAIEHIKDKKSLEIAIDQLNRKLTPNGSMFITTSASPTESWFHEPSKGWCFSRKDLSKLFNFLDITESYDDYEKKYEQILVSSYLQKQMPKFYFETENCGMPLGKWDPKYLPVGVICPKRNS